MKYILMLLVSLAFLLGACTKDEVTGKELAKQTETDPGKETTSVSQEEIMEALEKVKEFGAIQSEFGVQENPSDSLDKVAVKKRFRTIVTEEMYQNFIEKNFDHIFSSPSPSLLIPTILDTKLRLQVLENTSNRFKVRTLLSRTTAPESGGEQYIIAMVKEKGIWKFDSIEKDSTEFNISEVEVKHFFEAMGEPVKKVYRTTYESYLSIAENPQDYWTYKGPIYVLELENFVDDYPPDDYSRQHPVKTKYYIFQLNDGYSFPMLETEFQKWLASVNNQKTEEEEATNISKNQAIQSNNSTETTISNNTSSKEEYLAKLDKIKTQVRESSTGVTTDILNDSQYNYELWDNALNEIYSVLKNQLSESEMNELRNQQRQWVITRDQAAQASYDEEGGGSMSRIVYSETLVEVTKERCYELVNSYLK
ncbi:lysozyme inhibitor LprI family protein [Bacillus sp. OTU530]|uniref:lysozyme inhibitor LprI family protein n=1 Tax=Bacillus sp. OTU530 TaxID=3043862 RepID=UPI00313D41DA